MTPHCGNTIPPLYVASGTTETQGHCKRGGPRTLSKTTNSSLNCVFVKKHPFTLILDCKSPTEWIRVTDHTYKGVEDPTLSV